jgi:hypothetical protein
MAGEPMPAKDGRVIEWAKRNHAFVAWLLALAGWLVGMYVWATGKGDRPDPLPPPPPIFQAAPVPPPNQVGYSFGWHEDKEAADEFAKTLPFPEFADTPAGKAALGDMASSQLWKDVEKCWKGSRYNTGQPYPNVNQKSVGCCVGCATKHTLDVLVAVQVMMKTGPGEWRPFSVEAIYAAGRVDIGKGRIRGDGSIGGWSSAAANTVGNLPMDEFAAEGEDLRVFSPMKAREWGNRGVPAKLHAERAKYKVGTVTRVRSWEDCKKALAQDYPIVLCSNQGFEGRKDRMGHLVRDKDGFLAPGGSWPHAMALIGHKTGAREGGYILNSWGDEINVGPKGEGDPPSAGFWADASVINRMCQSGDCWAYSHFPGFPARKLKWRVQVPRRSDPLLLRPREVLPCEASLAA